MVVDNETSELICQSCGRVEVLFILAFNRAQLNAQEGRVHTTGSFTHFRKILAKYGTLDAVSIIISDGREECDLLWYRFLGNVIRHFSHNGKLVNYIVFLHDYFQAVLS